MQKFKTWADFAKNYDLVLFNQCISLNDGAVLQEWYESHTCESQEAEYHLQDCEKENCKKCEEIREDYGDSPCCECEPYQWYAMAVSEYEAERLNKEYDLDIFYSETLDLYILPVYHFGTAWTHVNIS